jgi:hypothetical protein
MKNPQRSRAHAGPDKLSLRTETLRILTERELILVAAGNCLNASAYSQQTTTSPEGACG